MNFLDPSASPTPRQIALLEKVDPRANQVFAAGDGVGMLAAEIRVDEKPFYLITPSPAALALSLAYKAHRATPDAMRRARFGEDLVEQDGKMKHAAYEGAFDFFELRMQHVIFSFMALEAYSNECIAQAPDPFSWKTTRRAKNGTEEEKVYDRERAERYLSLEEKLDQVLPALLRLPSFKGRNLWRSFRELKGLRDRLIHAKQQDWKAVPTREKDTVWTELYESRETDFSAEAHAMIMHFNGAARTWVRKFPYEELVSRAADTVVRRARNERKRQRKRR